MNEVLPTILTDVFVGQGGIQGQGFLVGGHSADFPDLDLPRLVAGGSDHNFVIDSPVHCVGERNLVGSGVSGLGQGSPCCCVVLTMQVQASKYAYKQQFNIWTNISKLDIKEF